MRDTLRLVRIGKALSNSGLETVAHRIGRSLRYTVGRVELVQYDPPAFEEIEASLLTGSLAEEIGGHILAVTDADLIDADHGAFFKYMFGGKDNRNDVAVVSTKRLRSGDERTSIARLLKVALHEVGHNFGLVHHYFFARAEDGEYCPMSKGDYNRYGERGYVRAVIDARGFSFCRTCLDFLIQYGR